MLTILGTLLGGLFRLAPEWLKYLNGKQDRAHEKDMFGMQLEADKVRASAGLALEKQRGENEIGVAELQAVIAATKAQAIKTGIGWIDGLSAMVRPVLTFWWCLILYTVALGAEFYALTVLAGTPNVEAILQLFGEDEKAIVASIFSFWFVDRALRRRK